MSIKEEIFFLYKAKEKKENLNKVKENLTAKKKENLTTKKRKNENLNKEMKLLLITSAYKVNAIQIYVDNRQLTN